jgi:DMSO/TMAO reductase YedYZ molybdopterin-dependent catalytic subunit
MRKPRLIVRGLHELYRQDPERADRLLRGRGSDPISRRGFLKNSGLLAMSGALSAAIPFSRWMPSGLIPAALADTTLPFELRGKDARLIVLNDRPVNAETPPDLLDDPVTPASRMFVRNNGLPPADVDIATWQLSVGGESAISPKRYTLAQLKSRFTQHSLQLLIECAGNGRHEFNPPAPGLQWTQGAVACPLWTGVRLRDVLEDVGIAKDAVYVAYYGADRHLSGNPDEVPISRGVPLRKALEDEALLAWSMNGEDLPLLHGFPLRLVCAGSPGSTSGKWLKQLLIRDRVHDGPKMTGYSYRIPCEPVAPGAKVAERDMCIIESMPVKSIITYPKTGALLSPGQPLPVRGHAWSGDLSVAAVDTSIDFGATWQTCSVDEPVNRLAWQHFSTTLTLPGRGYYEIWARATNSAGRMQPMLVPGWNPEGYLNNACHRIAVRVV